MENELDANDWIHNELAWTLYWFVEFFNICFFKDQPVPIPAVDSHIILSVNYHDKIPKEPYRLRLLWRVK